jgi:hypothetical protein
MGWIGPRLAHCLGQRVPGILGQEGMDIIVRFRKARLIVLFQKVPLMQIGPQVPELTDVDLAFGPSGNGPDIKAFLDQALEEDGVKSVLYIRSVTVYPQAPSYG